MMWHSCWGRGLYKETLQIRNVQKVDRFHSKLVSFLLSALFTALQWNLCTLWILKRLWNRVFLCQLLKNLRIIYTYLSYAPISHSACRFRKHTINILFNKMHQLNSKSCPKIRCVKNPLVVAYQKMFGMVWNMWFNHGCLNFVNGLPNNFIKIILRLNYTL